MNEMGKTRRRKVLIFCWGMVMWLPNLTLEVFDDTSDGFVTIGGIFISMGIVFSVMSIFLSKICGLELILGIMQFNGYLVGSLVGFMTYLVIGIIAHLVIKFQWGDGIFYYS